MTRELFFFHLFFFLFVFLILYFFLFFCLCLFSFSFRWKTDTHDIVQLIYRAPGCIRIITHLTHMRGYFTSSDTRENGPISCSVPSDRHGQMVQMKLHKCRRIRTADLPILKPTLLLLSLTRKTIKPALHLTVATQLSPIPTAHLPRPSPEVVSGLQPEVMNHNSERKNTIK